MKRTALPALLLAQMLAQMLVLPAWADEGVIDWQLYNQPPPSMLDGPNRGQGVLNLGLNKLLLPRLAQYGHQKTEVPIKRLVLALKTQPNACAFGLLKNPEREAFMQFSLPILPQLPPGIVVRRHAWTTTRDSSHVRPGRHLRLSSAQRAGAPPGCGARPPAARRTRGETRG